MKKFLVWVGLMRKVHTPFAYKLGGKVYCNPMHVAKLRGTFGGLLVLPDMYCPIGSTSYVWAWK